MKGRAAKVFTNRWIDKEDVVPKHTGILLSHEKENPCHLQQHGWTKQLSY